MLTIFNTPKFRCVNVHASLLPKLRGGSPLHHCIIDGYDKTGVTIMYMDKGMDSGDIITQKALPIDPTDNTDTLFSKLADLGASMINEVIEKIENGTVERYTQDESKVTFTYNLTKEDEKIDFTFVNSNLAAAYEALINKMDDIKDELKVYWLDV